MLSSCDPTVAPWSWNWKAEKRLEIREDVFLSLIDVKVDKCGDRPDDFQRNRSVNMLFNQEAQHTPAALEPQKTEEETLVILLYPMNNQLI